MGGNKIDELKKRNKPIPRPDRSKSYSIATSRAETPEEQLRRIHGPSDPIERAEWLIGKAEALEREANMMEGTCFYGPISPSGAQRVKAMELREHATLLLAQAQKKARRGERV